MTTSDLRLRCPYCNHLREGFTKLSHGTFLTPEYVSVVLSCRNCGQNFSASYEFNGNVKKIEMGK